MSERKAISERPALSDRPAMPNRQSALDRQAATSPSPIAPSSAARMSWANGPDQASVPTDQQLLESAFANNRDFVAALKADSGAGGLGMLPVSMYDEVLLRDAWGNPVVFMTRRHPLVGTAPQDRFFFFSAGPDRAYLTQDDNLYSYDDLPVK
jgi:hypothetical protein